MSEVVQKDRKTNRVQGWCFTLNNYTDTQYNNIIHTKKVGSYDVSYIVVGKENAPGTGTPHLQGFVYLSGKVSMKLLKTWLVGAHLEPKSKYSTFVACSSYCKKDGDYYEHGNLPKDPKAKGNPLSEVGCYFLEGIDRESPVGDVYEERVKYIDRLWVQYNEQLNVDYPTKFPDCYPTFLSYYLFSLRPQSMFEFNMSPISESDVISNLSL